MQWLNYQIVKNIIEKLSPFSRISIWELGKVVCKIKSVGHISLSQSNQRSFIKRNVILL